MDEDPLRARSVNELAEMAARARRLAEQLSGDPAALRLIQYADEIEAAAIWLRWQVTN
jgi:hypothetical protein